MDYSQEEILHGMEMAKNPIYLAGLFDGEGCISLSMRSDTGNHRLCVNYAQKDPTILIYIRMAYGGEIDGACHLRWVGISAKPILEMLLPYLVIKKKQALAALRFIETIGIKDRDNSTPDHIYKIRQEIHTILKEEKHPEWLKQ